MLVTTSLSKIQFDHKPTKNEKRQIVFQKQTIEIEQFYNHIINGGAFCNIYDYSGTFEFKGIGSKKNHYIGSQTINIDLDHQTETMEEAFNRVTLKPTFCYTTSSNGLPNEETLKIEYAFRFIYVFDEIINGKGNYINLYHKICAQEELSFDNRASGPYQNMFGNKNCQSMFTGFIYFFEDFNFNHISSSIEIENKRCKTNNIAPQTQHSIIGFAPFIEKEFFNDFKTTDFKTIIFKYKDKLRNIQTSPIPYAEETKMMIELPTDYYEIRRLFRLDNNGKGLCKKIKYGQHRKKKLYSNLMIRRLITEDLTPTELLYDLCFEMEYYIDNSDKSHLITKEDLICLVGGVMNSNLDEFRTNYIRPRNRIVNKRYAIKNNMSNRAVANNANAVRHHEKREELFSLIGEYYDCSLTIKENLTILKENGINISIDTLKRFKKENGLTRNYKKKKEGNSKDVPLLLSNEDIDGILSSLDKSKNIAKEDSQCNTEESYYQTFITQTKKQPNDSYNVNGQYKLTPQGTKINSGNLEFDVDSLKSMPFFDKPILKKKSNISVTIQSPREENKNALF